MQPRNPNDYPLAEIGLGGIVPPILYGISTLPFVGLVIGGTYALRRNTATRQLGRRLLLYAILLHLAYLLCVCPAAAAWALNQ